MKEEIYEKKNIICSSGNGAGIVRLFDEKSIQKGSPPDMDITEDDTTGNPVKEPEIPGNKADWTILMYVCGSDLESEDGFATDNFNEIKKIDFPDNINLVVEAGGTKKWHNGLDDNKLTRMVCKGSILWK